jgi:hypothetical protein
MNPLQVSERKFRIGDADFVIDTSPGPNRRPSDDEAWTIVKTPDFVNIYINLAKVARPATILELGIFQGGSFVFLDSLFGPKAISAVDLSSKPIEPLSRWVAARPGRRVHFGANQTDAERLAGIVRTDLGGTLDMVVDDASHGYEETKRSFEILFPLLSPAGHYVIEDWGWAHWPTYQGPTAPAAGKPALSNLIFELLMLQASTGFIAEIRCYRPLVIVRRSGAPAEIPANFWSLILARGREPPRI